MAPDALTGPPIAAVVSDVLGTLVDEDGGRTAAVRTALPDLGDRAAALAADWAGRVDAAVSAIAAHDQPFRAHDELEQAALTAALAAHGAQLPEQRIAELARFGYRLEPFPDVPAAFAELRSALPVVALTNAGLGQTGALSAALGWEWTAVVSAESMAAYKPDPRMYRRALELLGLPAERVLLLAAHPADLDAAAEEGLRTAFLDRGADADGSRFDLAGPDLGTLVRALSA